MAHKYSAVPYAYLEECADLSDEEFGRLMRGLLRYSRDGEEIAPVGNERFFIRRVMNQEDKNRQQYAEIMRKRAAAGRRGAESRWQTHDLPCRPEGKNGGTEQDSTEQYSTEQDSTGQVSITGE